MTQTWHICSTDASSQHRAAWHTSQISTAIMLNEIACEGNLSRLPAAQRGIAATAASAEIGEAWDSIEMCTQTQSKLAERLEWFSEDSGSETQ